MAFRKWIVGGIAAAVLTGCASTATDLSGSDTKPLTESDFASSLATATSDAQSVHVDGSFSIQGQQVQLSADEAFAADSGQATLADLRAKMTISLAGMGHLEMRLVDGSAYVDVASLKGMPGMGSAGLGGKPWVRVDLTSGQNPFGSSFSKLFDSMNASSLTKMFRSVTNVEDLGPANIDGVQTRHYRVTLDTAKVASMLGMSGQLGSSGLPKTLTYQMWIDADNRPLQMVASISGMQMTMNFSDWNEPVDVVAPPASQVQTYHS